MFPLTSALAVSALFFSIISAEAPDLSKVSLKSVSFGGSGCVQGTKATFKQTSDGKYVDPSRCPLALHVAYHSRSFVATFPNITASIGPGVNVEDNRKNCQLNLDVGYPPGLQYGAVSTRYAGTTVLDKGVKGVLTTTFYFSGRKFSSPNCVLASLIQRISFSDSPSLFRNRTIINATKRQRPRCPRLRHHAKYRRLGCVMVSLRWRQLVAV